MARGRHSRAAMVGLVLSKLIGAHEKLNELCRADVSEEIYEEFESYVGKIDQEMRDEYRKT
jgi:hypothetical protein